MRCGIAVSLIAVLLLPLHASAERPTAGSEKPRGQASGQGLIRATRLECESRAQPLSVEARNPHLSWWLQPVESSGRGLRQTAYRILVSSSRAMLADDHGDVWDTHRVISAQINQIEYLGSPLHSGTAYYWKVQVWDQDGKASAWSDRAEWTMGLLDAGDWKAKWIAAKADRSNGAPANRPEPESLPIFRHVFSLNGRVTKALARISGLGQFELRINGRPVNEDNLSPGWTDYRKRVFFETFDVTDLLRAGDNAIGILLGNGMYNVSETPERYQKFIGSMGQPKLIVQLSGTLEDGTNFTIVSDRSWKQTAGPIVFSSAYGGEDFDARQEARGWDTPTFNDSGWQSAVEVEGPGGKLTAEFIPPVKVMRSFPTVKVTEPKSGVRVYDLGQNFSGWPKIKVRGAAGTVVKLVPGELLDQQGLVSQRGSGEPVWFSYILRGDREETWHPRFTYYGFRYVQVEQTGPVEDNTPGPWAILDLQGQFVHSAALRTSDFASSSVQINQIHNLILAAVESNTQSVLTDCPHREKLGWLEQTHLLGKSLMYNYDLSQVYAKIADDMQDAQLLNGLVPDIAPEYVQFEKGFRDSPEWGSASILGPWTAYQHYGDQRILANHYRMMKRYSEYLASQAKNGVISYGLGDWYDMGPGEPGESKLTGRGLTATAIYYQDLTALQKVASLLGKRREATANSRKAAQVRNAFNAKLFNPETHQYDTGSQTANAMPLAIGLVPDAERAAVLANLIKDIRKHDNHVTAGDVGFHYVVTALLEARRSDVLVDMISRDDSPSYGYQLKRGATTLTEAWDTNPNSSQNHFMLGHIEEWFHRGLAGINIDLSRPRKERIVIRPAIVGDIEWVRDTQDSVLGKIVSEWKRQHRKLLLNVNIPVNQTAIVLVPASRADSVLEGGQPIGKTNHVRRLRAMQGRVAYEVDSGEYHFESTL